MLHGRKPIYAEVEEDGRLSLPQELLSRYGFRAGSRVFVGEEANSLTFVHPAHLAKLYVEPTNECNLACRTCLRNTWQEPLGKMSDAVFDRVIDGLRGFSPPPTVFFGGLGEPLYHPRIADMVARAKQLGSHVELITNGTLLTPAVSRTLLEAGIDVLWVSLDGATPESYADIRLAAELPLVIENATEFCRIVRTESRPSFSFFIPRFTAQLGIVFVAMKRNIGDLPNVLTLGRRLGARRFLVTNVLPYSATMREETLYSSILMNNSQLHLGLPRIEESDITRDALCQAMGALNFTLSTDIPQAERDRCPFIVDGAGAVGWDGSLSPCLPLLHSHIAFLPQTERFCRRWAMGNILDRSLAELWMDPEHMAFRERVLAFDFSPCTICGGCELLDSNEEDCFGNTFPTCGGCLWAQGVIQCP